jgi:hypothetical protein
MNGLSSQSTRILWRHRPMSLSIRFDMSSSMLFPCCYLLSISVIKHNVTQVPTSAQQTTSLSCLTRLNSRPHSRFLAQIALRQQCQPRYLACLFFRSLTVRHVTFQCTIFHPLLIPLCPHSTLRVRLSRIVDTMDTVSSTCQVAVAFSCRIRMIHPSLR